MTIADQIAHKLRARLEPTHLEVLNESGNHSVPRGSETHFRVVVVTPAFEGMGRVDRHKLVYEILAEELKGGVHALAVVSRTPAEWTKDAVVPESPECLGGSKADRKADKS
jgi:BolA protein